MKTKVDTTVPRWLIVYPSSINILKSKIESLPCRVIKNDIKREKETKIKKASSKVEAFSSGEQDRTADLRVMNPAL